MKKQKSETCPQPSSHTKLGEFFATAICGNDILSSALYVSGIASIFAGVWAPLILAFVAFILNFYRGVYREVVEALPTNGGAYNALLNGSTKTLASVAGAMTILSYIATAVISAKTAVEYLLKFVEELLPAVGVEVSPQFISSLVIPLVILVLLAFALLVISGVKDSAKVAAGIFIFHIVTLIGFTIVSAIFLLKGFVAGEFSANLASTNTIIMNQGGVIRTLFLAFSASLLGVSGFESSANFVEEQKKGVFAKTLRNMLMGVAIFNPIIALVVLNVLPLGSIVTAKDFLLAEAAYHVGGLWLLGWISINAFLVLCGAVLTGYVGVSGLVARMAMDNALPMILVKENKKGAQPRIILTFFVLSASILLITKGNLLSLAGVYTISFLGVMTLFAYGNLILKRSRPTLKRPFKSPVFMVVIAMIATAIGLIGNMIIDEKNIQYFLVYFIPTISIVMFMLYKSAIFNAASKLLAKVPYLNNFLSKHHKKSVDGKVYIFMQHPDRLFNSLDYVLRNENAENVVIVKCKNGKKNSEDILESVISLQKTGAFPQFKIKVEYLDENFSPEVLTKYAIDNGIPRNMIFIGSIHGHHTYEYSDFGGVRIIGG